MLPEVTHPCRRALSRPAIALAALTLAIAAVPRTALLLDDRTWSDEDAVLLQGWALYDAPEWPSRFQRSGVLPTPTMSRVLNTVRNGAYPPGMPLLVSSFRGSSHPVRHIRWLLFGLAMTMLVIAYRVASEAGTRWVGLLAMAYLASSPLLTHLGQQIKWSAIAPPLALISAHLLLRLDRTATWQQRAGYIVSLGLLLHVHYFCVWVIPGHALFVLSQRREEWRQRLADLTVGFLTVVPWYVWALPRQLAFVEKHFHEVARRQIDSWNAPVDAWSAAAAWGYDLASGLGFLPSPLRARYLLPFVVVCLAMVLLALISDRPRRRDVAGLALSCFAVALVAQTLYALKEGNVVPLQPTYLSPWVPLVLIAAMLGADEVRRAGVRICLVAGVLGSSATTVAVTPVAPAIAESRGPTSYATVCAYLNAGHSPSRLVVHPRDMPAKLMNIACPIAGGQLIGLERALQLPARINRLTVIGSCTQALHPPRGWQIAEAGCVSNLALTELTRHTAAAREELRSKP